MRTRQRHELLRQITHDLETLTHKGTDGPLIDHAIHKLLEYRARGYPTGSTQLGSIGSTDTSDSTSRAATTPDPYDRLLRELDHRLTLAAKNLEKIVAIARAVTVHATHRDQDTTPADRVRWCNSCARTRDSLGRTNHSPAHVTTHEITGVDDQPLCRWCYDFARQYHLLPPTVLVEAHHDGRRITQAMVDTAIAS